MAVYSEIKIYAHFTSSCSKRENGQVRLSSCAVRTLYIVKPQSRMVRAKAIDKEKLPQPMSHF